MTKVVIKLDEDIWPLVMAYLLRASPDGYARQYGPQVIEQLDRSAEMYNRRIAALDKVLEDFGVSPQALSPTPEGVVNESFKSLEVVVLAALKERCKHRIPTPQDVDRTCGRLSRSWTLLEPHLRQEIIDDVYDVVIDEYNKT